MSFVVGFYHILYTNPRLELLLLDPERFQYRTQNFPNSEGGDIVQ